MKFKIKSAGIKAEKTDIQKAINTIRNYKSESVKVEQPAIKDNNIKPLAKKVVYISKSGNKAIFDSIHLCAKIFDVDISTIKYKIEHPVPKRKATLKGGDWLKGGRLEYLNN